MFVFKRAHPINSYKLEKNITSSKNLIKPVNNRVEDNKITAGKVELLR